MSPYIIPGIRRADVSLTKQYTIDSVKKKVEDFTGISVKMMENKCRKREVVEARQIAIFLCKKFTGNSLKTIATSFGGRDHTTAIHSIATVKNLSQSNPYYHERVKMIEEQLCEYNFVSNS